MLRSFILLALLITPLLLAGCDARSAPPQEAAGAITDAAFLTGDVWNDGQAEITFYQVERTQNPYGEEAAQSFLVGTYLVKHDFDPAAMAKAQADAEEAVSAFKYALFYEFESGSYQYKRNYVVNATQADLTPLKASFTSFDWCSNLYRELAFQPNGTVDHLMRSDDYGNSAGSFDYQPHAYPVEALPLLIRGLDFGDTEEHTFSIVMHGGDYVQARARLDGTDTVNLANGPADAERIVLAYDAPVPSLIGEKTDDRETYWRGTGPLRLLLKMESGTGRYGMTLVEELRSPYWSENLWPRLERVTTRP